MACGVATSVFYSDEVEYATFSGCTDEQLVELVRMADAGLIDLYEDCGWRVGQERTISLSAIDASGTYDDISWSVRESHAAQTATIVLLHRGLLELVTPVLNKQGTTRNTCSFVFGLKNSLEELGYMNSSQTNVGSWESCARRAWCNSGFRQALPSYIRSISKQFKCITASAYNSSSNQITNDYFALAAAAEVFKGDPNYGQGGTAGAQTAWSNLTEFNALTEFEYYETASNRIKTQGDSGSVYNWWGRSPYVGGTTAYTVTKSDGAPAYTGASGDTAFSPFGCF